MAFERDTAAQARPTAPSAEATRSPGRTTLVEKELADASAGATAATGMASNAVVQRKATGEPADEPSPTRVAAKGVQGSGGELPHLSRIQASFGYHDVSGVRAHQGPAASQATRALGAQAYAFGDAVAFGAAPDLHTAAHEAAHVVQQRGGVQLKGELDEPGDAYERHADAVADAVVAGQSASALLDQAPGGGARRAAVQRTGPDLTSGGGGAPTIASPVPGINAVGFIDTDDGSNIRTGPAESGGQLVRPEPLPPATRVFVSGTHPDTPEWYYVTAFVGDTSVRGYVQYFRVATNLPEPSAELHQIASGDQAQVLAQRKFGNSVRDGLDLRFYENVLLHVNRDLCHPPRDGIRGSYQTGLDNDIMLVAGERIWLVSAAYALTLVDAVPHGSITGGAVATVNRIAGNIRDVLSSITESPNHFGQVAGEYAQVIREHLPEIIGMVAAFVAAEQLSISLAATGAGVPAAAVIQLILAYLGAQALVQASLDAAQHGIQWLTTAWNANGDAGEIAAASQAFVRMLVSIAMAVLAFMGMSGNAGNALRLANSVSRPGPALATATVGAGGRGGTGAAAGQGGGGAITGVQVGPTTGPAGPGILMMSDNDQETSSSNNDSEEITVVSKDSGRVIGKFKRGEYLQLLRSGRAAELFGGDTIALSGGRTVTVTGTLDDVNAVASRGINADGALNGATAMGENVGGVNILRSPVWNQLKAELEPMIRSQGRAAYWREVTERFWNTVNRPWLDQAMSRNDIIRLVSNPRDPLKVTVTESGVQVLENGAPIQSIFGREFQYLLDNGYTLIENGLMVRR